MIDTKNMNLNELSTATRENLESLGYGLRTIHRTGWQCGLLGLLYSA